MEFNNSFRNVYLKPKDENTTEKNSREPTSEDLALACLDALSEGDRAELALPPIDEALGYAFTLLIAKGVDDPDNFFKTNGIFE